MKRRIVCMVVGFLLLVLSLAAQTSSSNATSAEVPPLIQFSNVATDEGGNSLSGAVSITFSLYSSQRGGEALWAETQNSVPLDPTGHYSVQLGITKPNGVPTTLFTTGEARWLGVRIAEQSEQPRVLLLSVPYALKAGDAATLGGLSPSAFVLAAPQNGVTSAYTVEAVTGQSVSPGTASDVTTPGGTVNYFPLWDSTSDIISSVLFQSGTGATARIGINTATPVSTLDIKGGSTVRGILSLPVTGNATATVGKNSQPLSLAASAFNSSSSAAASQTFRLQAEPANNDSSSPSGTLNLLFGEGTAVPTETGLRIASNGQITFAAGQTFPGTGGGGTVTSVASGAGLSGGPITSSGTLSIATGGVTNAMLANPSLTITPGTDLTGGGAVALGGTVTLNLNTGLTDGRYAQLSAANTFSGNQIVNGNLSATGAMTGSSFQIGSNLFDYGSYANRNAFLGFAGNSTMTGLDNTGSGYEALFSNTTGNGNTASGLSALALNTASGGNTAVGAAALQNNAGTAADGSNTAVGYAALETNTTGFTNTAMGSYSGQTADKSNVTGSGDTLMGSHSALSTGTLSNATAIGAYAEATASNALVLGSIAGTNGATNSTSVGIGTTAPAYTLDVHGTGNFTGLINFAAGQTFPGAGTITAVNPGTALTGGGTSGSVTLNVDTTKIVTGLTAGTGLTGGGTGGALTLNVDTTKVPLLASSNAFTGTQTITGNIALPHTNSGGTQGIISFGGVPFVHDYGVSGSYNSFFGFAAGNLTNTGRYLTSVGDYALSSNTSGLSNTALGYNAGAANTTGSGNTFLGYNANPSSNSLTNAMAIGANAVVGESNALVLGGTGGNAVSVGIGTATPGSTLDVRGTGNFTGLVTFAAGQQFPGTVGLGTANTFTAPQTINTATGAGLSANATASNGTGVFGFGGYYGMWGETNSTAAAAAGVFGSANATSGQTVGVYGLNESTSTGAAGVSGTASGLSGQTIGVYGVDSSTTNGAAAVYGLALGNSGNTLGVYGKSVSSIGVGVYGVAVGPSGSQPPQELNPFGVWGDTVGLPIGNGYTAGFGVLGTAGASTAGGFYNNSSNDATLLLENEGSGGTNIVNQAAPLLEAYGGNSGKGCMMDVSGTLNCDGTVTAVVPTAGGARKVSLYAVQSPENWFEDFGSGVLSSGAATITLDATFTQTVNTGTGYHVFLTPNGDSKGLYVSQKTATSFEVREQGGGHSSIAFDYRIVAKRNGYENVRLADVTEQYKKMAEQRDLRRGRAGQNPARLPMVPPATPAPRARQEPHVD